MDVHQITIAAAVMAALAIAALIATGWRAKARVTADPVHSPDPLREDAAAIALRELHAPIERPTSWLRRAWSVVAAFGLAVWVGAALATVFGFGTAWLVVRLTDMLRK